MKGTVRRFLPEKRFGFIEAPTYPDHFFHIDDAINFGAHEVKVGMEVEFESHETEKGLRAYNVTA